MEKLNTKYICDSEKLRKRIAHPIHQLPFHCVQAGDRCTFETLLNTTNVSIKETGHYYTRKALFIRANRSGGLTWHCILHVQESGYKSEEEPMSIKLCKDSIFSDQSSSQIPQQHIYFKIAVIWQYKHC